MTRFWLIALLLMAGSLVSGPALAQTFFWVPTSGGLYNTGANWMPAGGPPNAASEFAFFDGTSTQTVTLQSSLTTSGHTIRAGNVTYQLDGTTQTMAAAGLIVGDFAGTTGRFTILNGTMAGDMTLGSGNDAIGFFTIGADALFDAAANSTTVGASQGSSGTLSIVSGGRFTSTTSIFVGSASTANGTVSVTGLGSSLSTTGTSIIGSVGEGELNVSSSGKVSSGALTIADAATAVGSVTVTGSGSTLTSSVGVFDVGDGGNGQIRVADGGTVTSVTSRIGTNVGAIGAATVTGAGSTWSTDTLAVGGSLSTNGGTGTLLIEEGGAVDVAGAMTIRSTAGAAVTIDGGTLTVAGTFTKDGTLNLRDGTLHAKGNFDNGASAAALVINGADPDDLPTLRLSGSTGVVSEVNSITVGDNNRGALILDQGRFITLTGSNDLFIGFDFGSEGEVTLNDPGTSLVVPDLLVVGGNQASSTGRGTLNVNTGTTVISSGTLRLQALGTINLNGGALSMASFTPNGGQINFNSGVIVFSAATTFNDAHLDAILGAEHSLGPGRIMRVDIGATTISDLLKFSGGDFIANNDLQNNSTISLESGSLSVAGALTNNVGRTLVIADTSKVNATGGVTNNGTILLENNLVPTSGGTLTNNGVIRGTGVIGNNVSNAATISVIENDLQFNGIVTNQSNTGLISGRDGTIRFQTGLTNNGSVAFSSGSMDVYGDVTQNVGGRVTVTGGGVTTFYDDVTIAAGANNIQVSSVSNVQSSVVFLGSYNGGTTGGGAAFIEGDHRPGNSAGLVSFGGDVFYGGDSSLAIEIGGTTSGTQFDMVVVADQLALAGKLDVSLTGGFNPAAGQSFDILDFTAITGTFDSLNLPELSGGLNWNISQLYTTGTLSVIAGVPGDFDFDGDVDGRDFLLWQRGGSPSPLSAGDLADWQAGYGAGALAGFEDDSARWIASPVPEPSSTGILLATAFALFGARRAAKR